MKKNNSIGRSRMLAKSMQNVSCRPDEVPNLDDTSGDEKEKKEEDPLLDLAKIKKKEAEVEPVKEDKKKRKSMTFNTSSK